MITCLSKLFSADGLLEIQDGLRVNRAGVLRVSAAIDAAMLRRYVDLTARLGVELAGMRMPLIGASMENAVMLRLCEDVEPGQCEIILEDGGVAVQAAGGADLDAGVNWMVTCYPWDGAGKTLDSYLRDEETIQAVRIDGKTASAAAILICDGKNQSRWEKISGAKAGEQQGSRKSYDRAKEHFTQNLDVRVLVEESSAGCVEAVLTAALRAALENYETIYPYGVEIPVRGMRHIRVADTETDRGIHLEGSDMIFAGHGEELTALAWAFAAQEQDPFSAQIVRDLEDILSCRNEIGQAARAVCLCDGEKKQRTLITREYARGMVDRDSLENYLSGKIGKTEVKNFHDGEEIFHRLYKCSWEGDDFLKVFTEQVLPQVKAGDRVRVSGRLSEDMDVRRQMEEKLREMLRERGAEEPEVEIFCSFKSGYSWLEEKVLPTLCALEKDKAIQRVEIRFPYLLNERGDDTFEDESIPNYGVHQDDPLKYFDIPTRWLQELFPVDELIAEKLELETDAVSFARDDSQPWTYRFLGYDAQDQVAAEEHFDVKYIRKPYMKRYPQIGQTHVTTGWLTAEINDVTVIDTRVETDPEKVWGILEDEILPNLEAYLTDQYDVKQMPALQPLFNRLQINLLMSETDRDLGYRQERISTVESMQEDIYFYILDWFKTYGERECGKELDNVGLIMPEPEIRKGKETQVEIILYEDLAKGACLVEGETVTPISEKPVSVKVERVDFAGGQMILEAAVDDADVLPRISAVEEMMRIGVIDFCMDQPIQLTVRGQKEQAQFVIPASRKIPSKLDAAKKDAILGEEVVDYDQYLELLRYYDGEPELRIFPVETTYKGRKIFAIECARRSEGVCYSANKLITDRISLAFTARHHGNEASSLNAAFLLLERLLTDQKDVLDRMNIVMVPFLNIDGGMLHCGVQRKHPKWLCHPARYNSAGFEFRKDFENPNTKYGESRVLEKLWKHYLFDVITDNHGFEGHELCQPFSGYISPWYKSFWIPRALYYGYIWFRQDWPHMVRLGETVRERVAQAINRDEEIYGLNQVFAERFYKYAQRWFPDLFTLDRFNEVVFYWIDTNIKPRAANYGIRSPEITALDWTTEVADETAVGTYMGTNVRAHHISDIALFDVLREVPLATDCAVTEKAPADMGTSEAGGRVYSRFRRRPLLAEAEAELPCKR